MSRLAIPKIVERSRRMSQEVTRGLDADLKDRENAKRDGGLEADCINFLVGLTGIEINDMMEDLKDGVILCHAINAIKPKSVKKINKSKMPFKQMENVTNFIKACRKLGVPEHGLFTTPDLYDGKSIVNVTNGIVALGSKAQSIPGYDGPRLGVSDSTTGVGSYTKGVNNSKWKVGSGGGGMSKLNAGSYGIQERETAKYRDISNGAKYSGKSVGGVTKLGAGSSSVMDRSQHGYHDISNGANYSGKSVGGVTKLGAGSSAVMDRSQHGYHDISKGANYSGKSVGGTTKASLGSSQVMERSKGTYHDITNGAKYSGASVGGSTMLSQGSSNTMERSNNQNFREITRGAQKPNGKPKPPPKPSRPKPFKTAAWDYVAAEDDELSMKAGDKITILESIDDDWGKGKNQRTGEEGMYPMNYVE